MGENYPWPRPAWCPRCRSTRLWGHGYVGRFFDGFEKALLLKRYRCPECGAVHTLRPHLYDRRFQVMWFTIFLSLLRKITHDQWLMGIGRQRQQYWWRGFKKQASRKRNFTPQAALATLTPLFEAKFLLATHSLTHYERTSLGEPPHRRLAFLCPWGVG